MKEKNLYELLGVKRGATPKEIRQAYIHKVKQIHPDRFNQETQKAQWEAANELLKELNNAHEILRDPSSRARYDHPISRAAHTPSRTAPPPKNTKQNHKSPPRSQQKPPQTPPPQKQTKPQTEPKKKHSPPKSSSKPHSHTRPRSYRRYTPQAARGRPRLDRIRSGNTLFESLPRSTQKRLKARIRGRNQTHYSIRLSDVTWQTFWVLILVIWFLFLFTELAAPLWASERIFFLFSLSLILASLKAFLLRRVFLWYQSPLRSWLFVTPLYIIRTHMNRIWYWPLWELSDIKVTPNYKNSKYRNTTVRLRFGTQYETLHIAQYLSCELLLNALRNFEQRYHRAKHHEDWMYFWEHDDFRDVGEPPPKLKRNPSSYGIVAVSITFSIMAFAAAYTWSANRDQPPYSSDNITATKDESYAPRRFTTSYYLETPSHPLSEPNPTPRTTSTPAPQTNPKAPLKTEPLDWKSLHDASLAYFEKGQYERSLEATNKALDLAQKTVGEDHPDYAISLSNLARIYDIRERYEDAKGLYEKALAIQEKALGPNHPDVATSLTNLAVLCTRENQLTLAESLHKRAIDIWDSSVLVGNRQLNLAYGLTSLAEVYRTQGLYAQAEPLYQRALRVREKLLGPKNRDVAGSLNNLAELYRAQGKPQQAIPLYERALDIWEESLGEDHPDIAALLNNLALVYSNQRQFNQAEQLTKRALAIQEKSLGTEHPDITGSLNNLANIYHAKGAYDLAEPLLKRSLAIREKALGPIHPDVATSLNNLAALYHAQSLYQPAEQLFGRSLAVLEKALGPDHPKVAQCLNNLGLLYISQGLFQQAEPRFERSRAIQEAALGPNHPDLSITLDHLALVYKATHRLREAKELEKRAANIRVTSR
ncbi:MAG: tetratricopeptide repeat protein [Verrucomicrobiota bacterium]